MIKNIVTLALASFSIAAFATPAAATDDEPLAITVSFGDLNLSNEAGRNSLRGRLNSAIERVCGEYDRRSVQQAQHVLACRDQVRREVDSQVSAITNDRIYIVVQEPRANRG
jgi:UrcA family protein